MKASDPSNNETAAVAPVQLDRDFGPNASFIERAAPGGGRTLRAALKDREVGL
jgi:hypothetical protein